MARYIDAEKINFSIIKNDFDRARAKVMVMATPTADVEAVRHGEWTREENPFFLGGVGRCSLCGYAYLIGTMVNGSEYCPNCGAKMDGGKQ